jgi:hypothetical protein
MSLELTDEEAAALVRELDEIARNDRYPLSPRIQALRGGAREDPAGVGPRTAPRAQAL